jgi:hypothetical protein
MKRIELGRGCLEPPSVAVQNQLKDLIEQPTQHRASGVVVSLHSGKRSPQNSQLGRLAGFTRWAVVPESAKARRGIVTPYVFRPWAPRDFSYLKRCGVIRENAVISSGKLTRLAKFFG